MNPALNTLFVNTDGSTLRLESESVVVAIGDETKGRVPLQLLEGIAVFGGVYITPFLLSAALERGIHVSWFSTSGRLRGRAEGLPGGNVLLRREQYRRADDPAACLAIARGFVTGKIVNSRRYLARVRRDAEDPAREEPLVAAEAALKLQLRQIPKAETLDQLRGTEGMAARHYFEALPAALRRDDIPYAGGRSRRPPLDPVNAALSFGYALLMRDCASALAGVGLDPAVGFLHADRPGRLSLALDLMEELRAVVVDRFVFGLLNRRMLSLTHFETRTTGAVQLTEEGRKLFITRYQGEKQVEVHHEFLNCRAPRGRVPHYQALLLARHLRGDLDAYPPYVPPG